MKGHLINCLNAQELGLFDRENYVGLGVILSFFPNDFVY
jgi:hypothetical protein